MGEDEKHAETLGYATPPRVRTREGVWDRLLFGLGLGLFAFGLGVVIAEREFGGAVVMGIGGFLAGIGWPTGEAEAVD